MTDPHDLHQAADSLLRQALWNLSAQGDDLDPILDDDRLIAAIRGQSPLTPDEYRRFLASAPTQDRWHVLADTERAMAYHRWRKLGFDPRPVRASAAADAERRVQIVHIDKTQVMYSVDFIPMDPAGRRWRINVEVPEAIAKAATTGLRLIDSEGLVWVEGTPDQRAILVGFWERDDDLLSRLNRVTLQLEPR
jgi:hypothetical protein